MGLFPFHHHAYTFGVTLVFASAWVKGRPYWCRLSLNLWITALVVTSAFFALPIQAAAESDRIWCSNDRQVATQKSKSVVRPDVCNAYRGDIVLEEGATMGFDRLTQLKYIDGNLSLLRVPGSDALQPLSNLIEVSGNLIIDSLPDLLAVVGLDHLRAVGNRLAILNNPVLENLDGLVALTTVGGLDVRSNPMLRDLKGLSKLVAAQKILITFNERLESLDGLEKISQLPSFLEIVHNTQLRNIDALSNVSLVGKYLYISRNASLKSLQGLASLKKSGDLVIEANPSLTDLGGLSRLEEINGLLRIEHNNKLASLLGLALLTRISEYLYIAHNSELSNIDALRRLSSVGKDFTIVSNKKLPICHIQEIVPESKTSSSVTRPGIEGIEIGGMVTVLDNKPECG